MPFYFCSNSKAGRYGYCYYRDNATSRESHRQVIRLIDASSVLVSSPVFIIIPSPFPHFVTDVRADAIPILKNLSSQKRCDTKNMTVYTHMSSSLSDV